MQQQQLLKLQTNTFAENLKHFHFPGFRRNKRNSNLNYNFGKKSRYGFFETFSLMAQMIQKTFTLSKEQLTSFMHLLTFK